MKVSRGLEKLDISDSEYIYWDDPNRLVDTICLLIASRLAGHGAIIEGLKRADNII